MKAGVPLSGAEANGLGTPKAKNRLRKRRAGIRRSADGIANPLPRGMAQADLDLLGWMTARWIRRLLKLHYTPRPRRPGRAQLVEGTTVP